MQGPRCPVISEACLIRPSLGGPRSFRLLPSSPSALSCQGYPVPLPDDEVPSLGFSFFFLSFSFSSLVSPSFPGLDARTCEAEKSGVWGLATAVFRRLRVDKLP